MTKNLGDGGPIVELLPPPKRDDPSIPTVYDDKWQFYVDLTPEQITAFQAMPEWGAYVVTQPQINYGGDAAATLAARESNLK